MRRVIFTTLLVLMAGPFCYCLAQIPSRLEDAPFTATRIETIRRGDEVSTTAGIVARKSDGSTYVELGAPRGSVVSSTNLARGGIILIFDVSRHRLIELYEADHLYTVIVDLKLTAQVWPAGPAAQLLRESREAGVKRTLSGGWETTSLGELRIGGVETIGSLQTNVSGRTFEKWYSPELDLNVESKQHQPAGPVDSEIHYEGIKVGEPDAGLFETPPGYKQIETRTK